jgi:hypothetical protein
VARQEFAGTVECVVLDNESIDGSAHLAVRAGARVFTFPRGHFTYGRALNVGIELCRGEVVVFLSAHAIPTSTTWLAELVAPVLDGRAAAAYCNQVPECGETRLERHRFRTFPRRDVYLDRETFVRDCRRGADPYRLAQFSNSACAVSRVVARQQPFRDLLYAEDRAFAVDVVMAGGTVAYVAAASVSYLRASTWLSAYRVAVRAQVSKRLIRELTATYVGHRFGSGRDTVNRVLRAAAMPASVVLRLALVPGEPRGQRRRAALAVLRATGATLGLARGCFGWRQHIGTLSVDGSALEAALDACRPVAEGSASPSARPLPGRSEMRPAE